MRFANFIKQNRLIMISVLFVIFVVVLAIIFNIEPKTGQGSGANTVMTTNPTFDLDPSDPSTEEDPDASPEEDATTNSSSQAGSHIIPEWEQLFCVGYAAFTGQFPEDGSDESVTNVASLLITNKSNRYLQAASLSYDIDGQIATFLISGIPAGRSVWVMEANRMQVKADSVFTYLDCSSSFADGIFEASPELTIKQNGNMLLAENKSDSKLENITVYYKRIHDDGNLFGGITYSVNFGALEPGGSAEKIAGHFENEWTKIVRLDYQKSKGE